MDQEIYRILFSWSDDPIIWQDDPSFQGKRSLPIPPEIGRGEYETISLPFGISCIYSNYYFNPKNKDKFIQIGSTEAKYDYPVLFIHSVRYGRVFFIEDELNMKLLIESNQSLFGQAKRHNSILMVDGSKHCEYVTIIINIGCLDKLITCAERLLLFQRLDISNCPSFRMHSVPQHLVDLLHNSVAVTNMSIFRNLFIQAKMLEYLAGLLEYFKIISIQEYKKIEISSLASELHLKLMSAEGKMPSMNNLAHDYKIPMRKLNSEFVKQYGEDIREFMMRHRLEKARRYLIETDIPMKALAATLGFSHVNYFITCFRRYFGCTPGSIRRRK